MSNVEETTELATAEERDLFRAMPITENGISLGTFGEVWYFARVIAKSQFAPKGMNNPADIMAAIIYGRSVGVANPFQALQNIAVINGRPSMWGDLLIGLVRGSGLLTDIDEHYEGDIGSDDFRAVCICKRDGQETVIRSEFSVRDAKSAGLWGKQGPWTQYPRRMLQMRARGFALRDGFADVLKGITLREEAEDYIDVTAEVVEPKQSCLDEHVKRHRTQQEPSDEQEAEKPPFVEMCHLPAPEAPAEKPRRGRPPGSKNKPKEPEPEPEPDQSEDGTETPTGDLF